MDPYKDLTPEARKYLPPHPQSVLGQMRRFTSLTTQGEATMQVIIDKKELTEILKEALRRRGMTRTPKYQDVKALGTVDDQLTSIREFDIVIELG
jgi:hypothetical protein